MAVGHENKEKQVEIKSQNSQTVAVKTFKDVDVGKEKK